MKNTSNKKTIYLLTATALILGCTGYYWVSSREGGKSESKVALHGLDQAQLEGRIQNSRSIGNRIQSQLKLNQAGSFRFGQGSADGKALVDQSIDSSFEGSLEDIVLEDDGILQKSFLMPSDFKLNINLNGKASEALAQKLQVDLAKGFVVVRDRAGLVKDLILAKDADDASSDFAFAIVKAMQFAMVEGDLKADWTSMEDDTDGSYQARYVTRELKDGILDLSREKILYSKLNATIESTMGGNGLDSQTKGETRLSYDLNKQTLLSAEGDETLNLFNENHQPIGENHRNVSWKFLSSETITGEALAQMQSLAKESFLENKSYSEQRDEADKRQLRSMYEARLGQDNFETILRALQDLEAMTDEEAAVKAQTAWFLKARALVYLHPEELGRIQDTLRQAKIDSPAFQVMCSALVNISSPEAQKVLADLALERRGDEKAMQSLIPDLGFVSNPEPFVEDALRSLQKDESSRGMADLALATMGSQLARDNRPESQERLKGLSQEMNEGLNTQDSEQLKHRLDMLGNLSASDSIPGIKEVLKSSDGEIRSKAAFALRDMKVKEAEAVLKLVLSEEKDDQVRVSAATALQNYTPSTELLSFQQELLAKESSEKVRIQLLIGIEKAKYLDKETVRQILTGRSEIDPSEQVRSYAALLLTEYAGS